MVRIFSPSLAVLALLALTASAALAEPRSVQLDVKGMNCSTCPLTIRLALKKTAGVIDAKVTLDPPIAFVTYDDARTTPAQLTRSTTNAGFPSELRPAP